jgi:hypothetical protein
MSRSFPASYLLLLTLTFATACIDELTEDSSTSTTTMALSTPDDDGGGGGGGGGGGPAIPPYNPPPRPFPSALNLPIDGTGINPLHIYSCRQVAHVGVVAPIDFPRGTPLVAWGVTPSGTKARFGIYSPSGQLVRTHLTQPSHDNCVIYQEPETITTSDLTPGYYFVYASFWKMSPNGVDDPFIQWDNGYPITDIGQFITAIRLQ